MKLMCSMLVALAVVLGTAALPARADDKPDPGQHEERGFRGGDRDDRVHRGGPGGRAHQGGHRFRGDEGRAMMEQIMMARMSKELELDDAQTVTLVRHFTDLRESLRETRQERFRLLRRLAEYADAGDDADRAAIAEAIAEIRALDDASHAARRESFEKASEGLEAWQKARLYLFLERFESDMRRLVERARRRVMEDHEADGDGEARRPGRSRQEAAPPEP